MLASRTVRKLFNVGELPFSDMTGLNTLVEAASYHSAAE
jgi:hypothetical protein